MARINILWVLVALISFYAKVTLSQDIIGCGGFVKSEVEINFSLIEVKLYTKQGSLKYQTDCAPNNGYYMIPVYDKGDYLLKVEPPPGWTFEPQSVDLAIDGLTDACSKNEDINFQFTGFGVIGKVASKGNSAGPAGVTLSLKKAGTNEVIKETLSITGGSFTFEKVLPGDYLVEAAHTSWKFEKNSTVVKVGRETGNAGSVITVLGYDVHGRVMSEGEPIPGVNFVLFSETVKQKDIRDCDESLVKGFPIQKQMPLCHVVSRKDGSFKFPALPCGKFSLVPFYKGELTTFDVVPSRLEFIVDHDSVIIKDPFKVAGFLVSGKVVSAKGGAGVPNAAIILNGVEQTKTKADGTFHLDSMKAGKYSLDVTADKIAFDTTPVLISPNAPQLPSVIASRFSACGHVVIDKVPEGQGQISLTRKVKISSKDGPNLEVTTDSNGKFCVEIKPGTYLFKVVISDVEEKAGLKLAPAEKEVKVVDRPIEGIIFSQFRAQVTGTIHCLENCPVFQLGLAAMSRTEERQLTQATPSGKKASFTFQNVMPGKYRVSLQHEDWCWEDKALEIEIVEKDDSSLTFKQKGYVLSCSLSHDITLNFAEEGKSGNVGSFELQKGSNKFCLAQPGIYKLTPVSCHQFEQETYQHDTSSPSILTLTAVRHLIEGQVTTKERQNYLTVTIKSSVDEKPTILGPLTTDQKEAVSKDPKQKSPESKGPYTYSFSHWARNNEKLTISLDSKELLFYPEKVDVAIHGDKCAGLVAKFEGKQGVFVEGHIQPTLAGVHITISPRDNPDKLITMVTDSKGAYRVGPLHGDTDYDVKASKEGYVLSAMDGKPYQFKAFKLGEIKVMVEDEAGRTLSGVLLSLSGGSSGSSYRSNKISEDDGAMDFAGLSPGNYFLRPMMKEYRFDPASQMIEVSEGTTTKIKIKGIRIAYSCYGSVTSLNGEAESDVFVEAVGIGSPVCETRQEESKTESDGSFRIRGLQPNCDYEIRLKSGDQINMHIERSAPKFRRVKVVDQDLADVNIIAFRRMNQMDISGNVITRLEHLSSLKVLLYKESNMDSPIQTVSLGATSFFYTSALKIDNQEYVIRLDSNLGRSAYNYNLPEILFRANASYRHFTFRFDPQRKPEEQELSQSSILALPLAIIVILISYNYKKLLPVLNQGRGAIQTMLSSPRGHSPPPSHSSNDPLEFSPDLIGDTGTSKKKAKLRKT